MRVKLITLFCFSVWLLVVSSATAQQANEKKSFPQRFSKARKVLVSPVIDELSEEVIGHRFLANFKKSDLTGAVDNIFARVSVVEGKPYAWLKIQLKEAKKRGRLMFFHEGQPVYFPPASPYVMFDKNGKIIGKGKLYEHSSERGKYYDLRDGYSIINQRIFGPDAGVGQLLDKSKGLKAHRIKIRLEGVNGLKPITLSEVECDTILAILHNVSGFLDKKHPGWRKLKSP